MMHATKAKSTPKRKGRGPTQFPGIVADARALRVNRATLYRVLTGEWSQLQTLRLRYDALKAKQARENHAPTVHAGRKGVK